jgi:[NiFe] hydrogenase assembly HybE family chaperone
MTTALTTKLEATFRKIQTTRMAGVPVINENLIVKAVHFQKWNDHKLGILITPWFMNLMLIPNGDTDSTPKTGTIHQHLFPSGSYDFVAGFEEEIGHYLSCSLFSPMFEFENQEAAELTASEALKAIMNEENIDNTSQNPANEIEQIWHGKLPSPEKTHDFDGSKIEAKVEKKEPRRKLSERLKEPTSRRDFLRAKAFRAEP